MAYNVCNKLPTKIRNCNDSIGFKKTLFNYLNDMTFVFN